MVYTKEEAAKYLKVSLITIDRARKVGLLAWRKIGDRVVFTQADIDAFLSASLVQAPAPGARG
jgi:excisionase family DNA binding protein